MTEETPKDQAAEDQPVPAGTGQGEADSEEYVSVARFEEMADRLVKQIEAAAKANRQSQADVIEHRVTKTVSEVLAGLQRPQQSQPNPGPEPDAPPQAEAPADAPPQLGLEDEIKGILENHGLDSETPELAAYMTENAGKAWWEVGPGFAALAEELAGREGVIQAAPGTGAAPRPDIEQEYIGKVRDLRKRVERGELRNRAIANSMDALRQEYFAKGVNVDGIVFNLDGSVAKQRQEDIASN